MGKKINHPTKRNYGSNQRFLCEGTALLSRSHLHHNTVCNINFRLYCLLEEQSMKSHYGSNRKAICCHTDSAILKRKILLTIWN